MRRPADFQKNKKYFHFFFVGHFIFRPIKKSFYLFTCTGLRQEKKWNDPKSTKLAVTEILLSQEQKRI